MYMNISTNFVNEDDFSFILDFLDQKTFNYNITRIKEDDSSCANYLSSYLCIMVFLFSTYVHYIKKK